MVFLIKTEVKDKKIETMYYMCDDERCDNLLCVLPRCHAGRLQRVESCSEMHKTRRHRAGLRGRSFGHDVSHSAKASYCGRGVRKKSQ